VNRVRPGFVPALVASLAVGSCTLDFGRFDPPAGASPGSGADGSLTDESSVDAPAIVPGDAAGDTGGPAPEAASPGDGAPPSDGAPPVDGAPPADGSAPVDGAPPADGAGPGGDGGPADAAGASDAARDAADASSGTDGGSPADAAPDAPDAGSLASGLVAYYMFDETSGTSAADSSGHGYTATLSGGGTFAAGLVNNALSFSGSGQYVSLPAGVVGGLTSFTVATWVKLNAAPSWSRIFDFGSGTTAYMLLTPSNGTNLRFAITTGGPGQEQQVNAPVLPTGSWQHVAVTLAPNTCTLYVNGALVGQSTTVTLTPSSLGATTQRWLGRSEFAADPYLNGLLDNFRVYSRALTGAEIQLLFAGHL
jgi:hypothetical protein